MCVYLYLREKQYKFIISLLRVLFKFCVNISLQYPNYHILSLEKISMRNSQKFNFIENSKKKKKKKKILLCKKMFSPSSENCKSRQESEESFRNDDDDSPTVYHEEDLFPLEHVLTPCARTRVATDIVVRVVGTCNV